jgi:hypothetical protein
VKVPALGRSRFGARLARGQVRASRAAPSLRGDVVELRGSRGQPAPAAVVAAVTPSLRSTCARIQAGQARPARRAVPPETCPTHAPDRRHAAAYVSLR